MMVLFQSVSSLNMSVGSVIDVYGVHQVFTVSHLNQSIRPFNNSRHQMIVLWTPYQVRPQNDGLQSLITGRYHKLFGHGLCLRIMGMIFFRIGNRLINTFHISAAKNNAGGTGIHKPRNVMLFTGSDHVPCPDDIGSVVCYIISPYTGFCRNVKYEIYFPACLIDSGCIADISLDLFNPHCR